MLSYHADPTLKARYLARVEGHAAADEIIKGRYWEAGKGCAVGCTVHGASHADYERELGIPAMLAWLEDVIFEGLPNRLAKEWPLAFLSAIEPGKDLSRVGWQFLLWLLTERAVENSPAVTPCVDVLASLACGEPLDQAAASDAAATARAVLASESPAPQAWVAECAARAAESASVSVTCPALGGELAATAVSAALGRSADYIAPGDKLLALLRAA